MKPRFCARLAGAACAAFLFFLAGVVHADGMLRASATSPAIAVASWVCDALGADFAPDGTHFAPVPLSSRTTLIVDMFVADHGTLLVATEQEGGTLVVTRVARGKARRQKLGRIEPLAGGRFVADGSKVALLHGDNAYLSKNGGRTFSPLIDASRFRRIAVANPLSDVTAVSQGSTLKYDEDDRLVRYTPGEPAQVLIDPWGDR